MTVHNTKLFVGKSLELEFVPYYDESSYVLASSLSTTNCDVIDNKKSMLQCIGSQPFFVSQHPYLILKEFVVDPDNYLLVFQASICNMKKYRLLCNLCAARLRTSALKRWWKGDRITENLCSSYFVHVWHRSSNAANLGIFTSLCL